MPDESIAKRKRKARAAKWKVKLVHDVGGLLSLHEPNDTNRWEGGVGDVVLFHVTMEMGGVVVVCVCGGERLIRREMYASRNHASAEPSAEPSAGPAQKAGTSKIEKS